MNEFCKDHGHAFVTNLPEYKQKENRYCSHCGMPNPNKITQAEVATLSKRTLKRMWEPLNTAGLNSQELQLRTWVENRLDAIAREENPPVKTPTNFIEHDWDEEPIALGDYRYYDPRNK